MSNGQGFKTPDGDGGKSAAAQGRYPTVAILGMGFGGLWAAKTLASAPLQVRLVDRHNYHTFFPLLYQVGAAELEPEDIAQPVRNILRKQENIQFILGNVQQVDLSARTVRLSDRQIQYDYLILGLGSRPSYFGINGAAEYAFPLRTVDQGVALRNHILACFERAEDEADPQMAQQLLTFAIIGGGPTGVEFAGALAELVRGSIHKDYPTLNMKRVKVLLVEASDHLLEGMPRQLSTYAQRRLAKMGVEVRMQSKVVEITPHSIRFEDNSVVPVSTTVWTAGVAGQAGPNQWGLKTDRHGQVDILPSLQVPEHPEVYVIGDQAAVRQNGKPLPMVAQVAMQTGTTAAKNILRQIAGQEPLPFTYHDKGTLAVIGRNAATASIWGRTFEGFPAWMLWLGVHILNLIGFRNRLMVMINWAWDYFFFEHAVRLIEPSAIQDLEIPDETRQIETSTPTPKDFRNQ